MRLADDDRARIPFAIVGVVLILGSTAYVTTVQQRGSPVTTPDAELVNERLDAAIDSEVSGAIRRAGEAAAHEPVVDPADTVVGNLLDESDPFGSYLRLRIYLEVRRSLSAVSVSSGDVTGQASVPPTPDPASVRKAIDRVHVDHADQPGTITVRIENVSLELTRNGAVIHQRERTLTRTVSSPVLLLHERVETYENRLNESPLDGPGLGQRLSAQLYGLAWARGYLQYVGVPIQNVIGTRHVEVTTNRARLATQRSVFGRSDPRGRAAMSRAMVHTGIHDVLSVSQTTGGAWIDDVLDAGPGVPSPSESIPSPSVPSFQPPGPEAELTVGVNVTADTAFASLLDHTTHPSLNATLGTVYSADVRLQSAVHTVRNDPLPEPNPPADNWTLVDEQIRTETVVSNSSGPVPPLDDEWDRLKLDTRRVETRHEVTWTWVADPVNNSTSEETTETWTVISRVGVSVDALHSPTDRVPRRGVDTVYEQGGPFGGSNLADVESAAITRLVDDRGGPDALATRAHHGRLDESRVRIEGERPDELAPWVYDDLATLREAVRVMNVTVERGAVGVGQANGAAQLAGQLRERRSALVNAPETYGSIAEKSRFAARGAYVDGVIQKLDARAAQTDRRTDALGGQLATLDFDLGDAGELLTLEPDDEDDTSPLYVGADGPVEARVSGSPAYLTVEPITTEHAPVLGSGERFYPLATRNHNLIAAPYGDVADAVVDAVLGENIDTVDLEVAALTLASANRTLEHRDERELESRRDELQGHVQHSLDGVSVELATVISERTSLTVTESRVAVHGALSRWDSVDERALAVTDGRAATVIATEVDGRTNLTVRERDHLTMELRLKLYTLTRSETTRVHDSQVEETATITRTVASHYVESVIEEGANRTVESALDRWRGRHLVRVPAGLPLTPVPGFSYATANVWNVSAHGTYARFTISARTGTPNGPTTVSYHRDGSAVELDVFDDGEPVVLGYARRVSFEVTVPVIVVVPPGGAGVGDVDGTADERSEGWPESGTLRNALV